MGCTSGLPFGNIKEYTGIYGIYIIGFDGI